MKLTGCTPATGSFSTTRAQGEERLSSPGKSQGEKLCQKLKDFCKSYRICQKHCDNSLKYCDNYLKINCHKNLSKERENMQHFFSSKRSKAFADFVGISFLLSILPTPTIRSPLLPFLPISWDSRRQVVGIVYLPNLITKPLQLQKTTKNSP